MCSIKIIASNLQVWGCSYTNIDFFLPVINFVIPLVDGGCEPIHPVLLEVGGRGLSWRWCRCSVFFVAVEEEGQGSESCGGRFGALSGQQLQHLLPLNSNHTGCYCS